MITKNRIVLTVMVLSVLFASCNRRSQLLYMKNIDETTELPHILPPAYKLAVGDILFIQLVTPSPEISISFNNPTGVYYQNQTRDESSLYLQGYTIDPEGHITLPFMGTIPLLDKTLQEARNLIQEQANQHYKDASVVVKLASFKVTIMGEVRRPGTFRNFNDNLNIFEALAAVGDISENGDRKKVLVVRPTQEGNKTYRLNLNDRSVLASEAFYLLPNDVVIVEPIGNKVFQMNIPYITLGFSTLSSFILLYNFINTFKGQ